jgi:hypothetical protein
MAKKTTKPAPLPVTAEAIDKAAQTNTIKDLVRLSDAFYRVGVRGPFTVELPLFTSVFIGGDKQQYRRMQINIGMGFNTERVSLGKKSGLIFAFAPATPLDRNGEAVERIEMGWDDLVNTFADLADRIEEYLDGAKVSEIDEKIKATIARNPSMHKILVEGFSLAQTHSKEAAADEQLETIDGFGMF